ncbi:MAG: YafY family protein [Oscillospiraceae bacterium]
MKLNRLLEITTVLLNKKNVTAAELAERFSVSVRTIYRDIDVLSASGVPVYATQGANGGISILEDYTVSRTALSDSERDSILFALQTLQSTKYPEVDIILKKLGGIFKQNNSDWISIDFSPWGANPNAYHKFTDIKTAIIGSKVIEIEYVNSWNEKSTRKIEPLRLIFKSQAWYLWGYCLQKQDYRTFRISRIKKVTVTDENFDRREVHIVEEKPQAESQNRKNVHLVLEFTEEALYRLCDDYDDDMMIKQENGNYRVTIDFPEDEWVYGYILSFGSFAKVVAPEHIKNIVRDRAKKIVEFYK